MKPIATLNLEIPADATVSVYVHVETHDDMIGVLANVPGPESEQIRLANGTRVWTKPLPQPRFGPGSTLRVFTRH